MDGIHTSLFEGSLICLTPIDPDNDAPIESRWTHDPVYTRLVSLNPVRPLSPAQVKKKYEAIDKEMEEKKNLFHMAVRTRPSPEAASPDSRLVGFARLQWIEWNNGCGAVQIGIGDPNDRHQGYGREALSLMLHYAFAELNLFRLAAIIPEYNLAALGLFQKAGFVEEVRRRESLNRDGRRWDLLHFGLLCTEWGRKAEM